MIGNKRWLWIVLAAVAVLGIFCLPAAFAQADVTAAPAAETGGTGHMTLKQIMQTGGGVMYVLAGASFLTVAFVVYFAIVIRVGAVAPRVLQREIIDKIKAGNLDEVRRTCEYRPCPLSSVVLAAVDYMRNAINFDQASLKDMIEGEGARQADAIQGQAQYLLDIAVLSPMLGLLGTVVGMLEAFRAVALEGAVAKPVMLATGVSQALVATAFGLIVGIPAMGFYGYFRRKASKVVSHLEVVAIEVLIALSGKRTK